MTGPFAPANGTEVEIDGAHYRYVADGGLFRWRPIGPRHTYRHSGSRRLLNAALDRIAELEGTKQ